jgi:hypothetical protein
MANVGRGRPIIERCIVGIRDKGWSIGGHTGIPGRAVVQILGKGIVAAELKSSRKRSPQINFKGVVFAGACEIQDVVLASALFASMKVGE